MTDAFTHEEVKADAAITWRNMMAAHSKADVKRGYNRFVGSIPSQNDVVRKGVAHLQFLNTVCIANGWKLVWEDPDEKPVNPGSLT